MLTLHNVHERNTCKAGRIVRPSKYFIWITVGLILIKFRTNVCHCGSPLLTFLMSFEKYATIVDVFLF
jgi:hypothetical protein